MRKFCSICSAPDNVRTAINQALADREPLRSIAKRSAFSRAALSRHSRKCVSRETVKKHRDLALNQSTARLVIAWPEMPLLGIRANFSLPADESNACREIDEAEIRADDVLIAVQFEPPKPRNHKAASPLNDLRDVPIESQALSHEN